MNNLVPAAVVAAMLLLMTGTEAVVVKPVRLTNSVDIENCTESIKLVPTLLLVPPGRSSSLSSPTLATLSLPHMTTQPLLYPQPYDITHLTPHATITTTTTPTQLKYKTTPTLHKTPSSPLTTKKYTTLNGKLRATQYIEKHTTTKLDNTHNSLATGKDKYQSFSQYPESSSSSSVYSSSSSTALPSPIHVTVPPPNHPSDASTLSPPSPTLPLPIVSSPSTTTTPKLKLPEIWEKLKYLLGKHIPLVLTSEWALPFEKSYLERIRAVNHEMVDKLLQAEDEDESTDTHYRDDDTCHLPEKRLARLSHLRKVLVLLLQALPQTVEEVEEAAWNPEITDYTFRPERRAVFDVYGCRQCYALDASGVCREMFYCKDGEDVFSRTSRRRPVG